MQTGQCLQYASYQQAGVLQPWDAPQQLNAYDACQAANALPQTQSPAGIYQQDASYGQTYMYQQLAQYQQPGGSGQLQSYQQLDTYASDTTYDTSGNVVDQSIVTTAVDGYFWNGGDGRGDVGCIGPTGGDSADAGGDCDSYGDVSEAPAGDCSDLGSVCGGSDDDSSPDLSLDFATEDNLKRQRNGLAWQRGTSSDKDHAWASP